MNLYFIAIVPPEPIREEVRRLKLEMSETYESGQALKSPAHISLQMPFRYKGEKEHQMIQSLQSFASRLIPFKVELRDFGFFAPRVIFIKVVDHKPLLGLKPQLEEVLRRECGLRKFETGHKFQPHMTIATRDLKAEIFPQAREDISGRKFEAVFQANSLVLLKHNSRHWEIYREFDFGA